MAFLANGTQWFSRPFSWSQYSAPLTFLAWVNLPASPGSSTVFGIGNSTNSAHTVLGCAVGSGVLELRDKNTGGGVNVGPGTVSPTGVWTAMAARSTSSLRSFFIGGGQYTDTTSIPPGTALNQIEVGNYANSAGGGIMRAGGLIAECAIWASYLSDAACQKLTAGQVNPLDVSPGTLIGYWPLRGDLLDLGPMHYALAPMAASVPTFSASHPVVVPAQKRPRVRLFAASGGGTNTATGAATIGGATAAGAGSQTDTGTVAATIGAATAAGSGSQTDTATGAATTGALAASGTASQVDAGTGAAALGAFSAAGAGTGTDAATGVAAIGPITATGTASSTDHASGAASIGAVTAAGTGGAAGTDIGTGTATLGAVSAAGVAAETDVGSGAAGVGAVAAHGTGSQTDSGTGAASTGAFAASGGSAASDTATGAATIGGVSAAGVGSETDVGTGAAILPGVTATGAGGETNPATGMAVLGGALASGTASETDAATGAASIAPLTAEGAQSQGYGVYPPWPSRTIAPETGGDSFRVSFAPPTMRVSFAPAIDRTAF